MFTFHRNTLETVILCLKVWALVSRDLFSDNSIPSGKHLDWFISRKKDAVFLTVVISMTLPL